MRSRAFWLASAALLGASLLLDACTSSNAGSGVSSAPAPVADVWAANKLLAKTINLSSLEAPNEGEWAPRSETEFFESALLVLAVASLPV